MFAHQLEFGIPVMGEVELLFSKAVKGVTDSAINLELTEMDILMTRRAFSAHRLETAERYQPLRSFSLFCSMTLRAFNRGVASRKGEAGHLVFKDGLFKHLLGMTSRAIDLKLAEMRVERVAVTTFFEGHLVENPAAGMAAPAFNPGMSSNQGKTGLAMVEPQAGGFQFPTLIGVTFRAVLAQG